MLEFPQKAEERDGEAGMIVVEAVISFSAFIMVCIMITFMINIFMLHNRVQFAINSAAQQIASYSYMYDALGARDAELQIISDGKPYTENIDKTAEDISDTLDKIQNSMAAFGETQDTVNNLELSTDSFNDIKASLDNLAGNISDTYESGKQSVSSITSLLKDPKGLLVGVIYLGADGLMDAGKRALANAAASALTESYLNNGKESADAYLLRHGVIGGYDGLDFSSSGIFCDSDRRVVDIVVEYDVDLSFINFVLPNTNIHVVQRVSCAGWVGGDGIKLAK